MTSFQDARDEAIEADEAKEVRSNGNVSKSTILYREQVFILNFPDFSKVRGWNERAQ